MKNENLLRDGLGWGFLLWLLGYILGIIFFMILPPAIIGWVITPLATTVSLWVLIKRIKAHSFVYYLLIAVIWLALAVVLDYLLIVKTFKPEDGYYKSDVFI